MDWGWWEDKPPKKIFDGLVFSISLQNESMSTRKQISDAIKKNGGSIVIGQPKELTHLVAGEREINENGLKIRSAYKNKSYVVLPSFVHDSIRYGQKLQEWNYTIIAGKPARQIARDEEEMVMGSLTKGIDNIYSLLAGAEYVEQSFHNAVSNIRSLFLELAHNEGLDFEYLAQLPVHSQIAETIETLSESVNNKAFNMKKETKRNLKETAVHEPAVFKTSAFEITSVFTQPTLLSNGTINKRKPTALQLQIEAKKRERAEKLRKIDEEKKRKEEERQKKEAERLQRQAEAKKKSEELRLRFEESQRKLDFLEFGGYDFYEPNENEMNDEKRLQMEEEKKKQEEKLARKALKHEKKLRNKVDHILKHREMRENRLAKKETQKKQIEEEKKQKVLEKELARKEYAERQERKRLKILEGEAPPPPTDDNRKLYVGGIKFDDLKRLPKKLNSAAELAVKKERIKNLVKLFEKFGKVEKLKDTILAKGFGFIIYKEPESVEKALAGLGKFEDREKLTKEMKAQLEAQGGKTLAVNAPNAHFYIRIVHSVSGKKKAFNANERKKEKTTKKYNSSNPTMKEGKQEVTS